MQKSTKAAHEYMSDGVKSHSKSVTWSFPITDVKPEALVVELRRSGNETGFDDLCVTISGLMNPYNAMGPNYFGNEAKDPILHALAKRMLVAFEMETKDTVRFTRAGRKSIQEGLCIRREDNHSAGTSSFHLCDWHSASFFGRSYRKADADKLYAKFETLIEGMKPEIEAAVAQCAANRPPLTRHGRVVPEGTLRELAWQDIIDARVAEAEQQHPRVNPAGGWDKNKG